MESVEQTIRRIAEQHDVKAGLLIHALRTGLTGQLAGPGIFDVVALMGKEKTLARLEKLTAFLARRGDSPQNN
jgi:glutamyl-tRNA synthetase